MEKSLDQKLQSIRRDPHGAKDFILADAKDADMSAGLASPGKDHATGKLRSIADYRDQMREIVKQGLIDIMLMSASCGEILIGEHLFNRSAMTPAIRANDTSDIHMLAGAVYCNSPSRPFASVTIDEIKSIGGDLALWSVTPNNHLEHDLASLEAYKNFRIELQRAGMRHFLEIFDPNACEHPPADLGRFINDFIARTLAGVVAAARPLFFKMAYHGPKAMDELLNYDPTFVVGILGGSSGTTHDAFHLLEQAKKHGARAALFGRKIKDSEHQLTFVTHLHAIANGQLSAAEAVKAYHGEIEKLGIKPKMPLKSDLELTIKI
jgi:hypothetical protein